MLEPLYTSASCSAAYQLRWSLALFAKTALPDSSAWREKLAAAVERDGVRILEFSSRPPNVYLFVPSTRPDVAPPAIVRSIKGRLQHLLQPTVPDAFRRNFSLTSVGDARADVVEAYVAKQLGHHESVNVRASDLLERYQLNNPEIRLDEASFTAHGRYIYNLHLVLVHAERWRDLRETSLSLTRDMIVAVAKKRGHALSRVAILPDHIHLVLRGNPLWSPQDTALGYLSNIAYARGQERVFQYGFYVGTIGAYDMQAIRNVLQREVVRSTDTGSVEA